METFSCKVTPERILNASSNALIATDSNGTVTFVNRCAEEAFANREKTVLGKQIEEVVPAIGGFVGDCLETGVPIIGKHVTGGEFNTVVNVTPIKDDQGILGAVASFKQFLEFEQFAEELGSYKKQNKLLNVIFQASSDGLWVLDKDGVFIDINPASEQIIEVRAEDVIGHRYDDLESRGVDQNDINFVNEVFDTKRRLSLFARYKHTGKRILSTATPVLDDNGEILYVVGNERDLTELNQMKDELEEVRQISDRFKDELNELQRMQLKDHALVAESKQMQQVVQTALKLSALEVSHIMITGESGTGKGLLAKFIHENGSHRNNAFIQINCAALPDNLLEAELFGYEKGAFTGAGDKGKAGLIELAHEGTLFLDEVGDMPLPLQTKLLKYLDDHEVMRLGSLKSKKIDCCILSATNQDLEKCVAEKNFRGDLFYRLTSFHIHIPPLRERPEDILELACHYLDKYNRKYSQKKRASDAAFNALLSHSFDGNVRELKNLLNRAVVMSDEPLIDQFLFDTLNLECIPKKRPAVSGELHSASLEDAVQSLEKEMLLNAMDRFNTTREMAKHLKTSHSTIVRKLQKYGLTR